LTGNTLGQIGAEELRNGELASSQRVTKVVVMVDRALEVTFVSFGFRDHSELVLLCVMLAMFSAH